MNLLIPFFSAFLLVPCIFSQTTAAPSLNTQKKQLLEELGKTKPEIKETRTLALKATQAYSDAIDKRPELADPVKARNETTSKLMKALADKDAQATQQFAIELQTRNKAVDTLASQDPVLKELREAAVTAHVKSMTVEAEALESVPEGRELLQKLRDSKKKR